MKSSASLAKIKWNFALQLDVICRLLTSDDTGIVDSFSSVRRKKCAAAIFRHFLLTALNLHATANDTLRFLAAKMSRILEKLCIVFASFALGNLLQTATGFRLLVMI